MSENVKIKINEYDRTSPSGRGIDSTDIAFIPGFSSLFSAPRNIPTLVTSTQEFERIFGSTPYVLNSTDVETYPELGLTAGEYDKSYIYAKELLLQGLPVVYTNVVNELIPHDKALGMPYFTDFKEGNLKLDLEDLSITRPDSQSIKLIITASNKVENKKLRFRLPVNLDIANNKGKTLSFEKYFYSKNPDCKITHTTINKDDLLKRDYVERINTYGNRYEVLISEDIDSTERWLDYVVDVTVTLLAGEHLEIDVMHVDTSKSSLDAMYPSVDSEGNIVKSTLLSILDDIADKSLYSVKYITSGGYPSVLEKGQVSASSKFASEMMTCAENRGDAVALIDYQFSPDVAVYSTDPKSGSVYSNMQALFGGAGTTYSSYGAAMYPWSAYNTTFGKVTMPASFGYLMCVAKAIKSSPNWLAMAGVSRGLVPSITELCVPGGMISNTHAEEMQPKFGADGHNLSINTITNVRPYGLTLWGNRTMMPVSAEGTTALNFLNTRNMLSDIKKLLYTTAKSCMFEQNSTDLWIKFKAGIEPLLRRLKAGNGISDYKIVRGTTKYDGNPLTKGEIAAVIKIYPMHAVEYFELAVEINDEDVTVS